MIRFSCEHCSHKIGVQDKHAGKRGKCPECGNVIVIPAKSTIIEFHCKRCGHKISVPQIHAGKKARCPKCKKIVIIPARPETPAKSVATVRFTCSMCNREIEEPETSRGKLVECPHCGCYAAVPSEKMPAQEAEASVQPGKEDDLSGERFEELQRSKEKIAGQELETVAERKLPWIFDIFLYPSSKAGLTTLAIIIVIPLLFRIVVHGLLAFSQQFPPMIVLLVPIAIIGIIVRLLLYLYLYWYFCECIRDSAAGGVRAPETLASTPGLLDLLWQWFRTVICLAVFALPMLIYYKYTKQTDTVFWALLAFGVFFLPMGLLSVVMFDSLRGLNPIMLIGSIFSTFLPYGAMIVAFGLAGFLIAEKAPDTKGSTILPFILQSVIVYLIVVVAHLLGWFYHRYEQQLNWDV